MSNGGVLLGGQVVNQPVWPPGMAQLGFVVHPLVVAVNADE